MHQKGTSKRSTCETLETLQEYLRTQFEDLLDELQKELEDLHKFIIDCEHKHSHTPRMPSLSDSNGFSFNAELAKLKELFDELQKELEDLCKFKTDCEHNHSHTPRTPSLLDSNGFSFNAELAKLKERYVPEEELPEISDVAKIENELTLDEVNSKLTPLEEMSDDHQALEKPVEREQIERTEPVQETGSTQNLTEMKKEQFAPRTKILADDESLEKDPRGSLERFGSYSILDVNVEHAVGKTFGTFLSNQPDKQRAAEEEAAFEAVILSPHFAYQVTGRSTEESQVARSLLEGSLQDYFSKSTNDSSKRVKNNLATLAPQTPHLPVIVSENHFIQTKLQSPHLHFSWKVPSVSATVSPVPPNPETNPYDPALLQTQVQQDMLVPTENSQIDGFSPNYPNKVITEQKRLSGVLDSSPAQTGCGNPQVPLHMGQQLYSSSGQNSKPLDGFANISSRLPPDKPQCSPSVRCSLKMKLKKHSTGERHQPYTLDKKSNNDLLPNLDEIHTPF